MKTITLTAKAEKEAVVYTKSQILANAGKKLADFGLTQDNLLSVSYLQPNEEDSKNGVVGIILKGVIKQGKKSSSLLVNFYDNGRLSYLQSTGNKDSRKYTKISKDMFGTLVNQLENVVSSYDTF